MSFGDGNLRERVEELERDNARLTASLLAATECTHADWPALALDWDNTGDERKREWCQFLYEHAAKQDGRIEALEQENARLRSLARDMYSYAVNRAMELCSVCTDANGDYADCAACDEYDGACGIAKKRFEELYADSMAELGIETEGGA